MEARLSELKAQISEKDEKLSRSEEEVIKLTKKCAELMTKDLKSGTSILKWDAKIVDNYIKFMLSSWNCVIIILKLNINYDENFSTSLRIHKFLLEI